MSKTSNFQDLILSLQAYWAEKGCLILQPFDMEVGAGTFHPATTPALIGPSAVARGLCAALEKAEGWALWREPEPVAALLPVPGDTQTITRERAGAYLDSLRTLGIDLNKHDIRFVEDDWGKSHTRCLGPWLGSVVRWDGDHSIYLLPAGWRLRLRSGIGRNHLWFRAARMYVQGVEFVYDLQFNENFRYGEVFHQARAGIFRL